MPTPSLHSVHDISIDSLANSGDGVARLDGRVLFVPLAAPGDRVRVRIVAAKKHFLKGRLLEVLEPGPDRVAPPCGYFGSCGGCDWQHLAYPAQLEAKRSQLEQTLVRIGGLSSPPIDPIVACERPYRYRNRIQGTLREGTLHLRERGSGAAVAIARCEIADERINELMATGLPAGRGGRVELVVVDGAVQVHESNGGSGSGRDSEPGSELGFRQVNDEMAVRLERLILDEVAASGGARVLDLYCGRGAWTCEIAAASPEREVIGIEAHAGNVRAARERQAAMGLDNVRFRQGKVEKAIAGLPLAGSLCIVDPPRAGLDERVLAALVRHPPESMIYVSCHPATLARDLKALIEGGYGVERVVPLDMFPQTAHLECWVGLRAR